MDNCLVYLSDGKELLVKGKDVYWSWFESEKTITFYATDPKDEIRDDIRVAEFCKACVLAIVYIDMEE